MEKTQPKIHYAWWILVAMCAMMLAGQGIINNCAGIFYSHVADELGVGRGTVSLYMTIGNLACCVALPFAGPYLMKCNVRKVLPGAMTLICINAALMSVYKSVWCWYIAGVIQGALGAFIFLVPAPLILSNWFYKKSGFAIGFAMAFSGLGGIIFNPLIYAALAAWGWRTAYLVYAGFAFVIAVPLLAALVRYKPEDMGLKPYGWDEAEAAKKAAETTAISKPGVLQKDAVKSPIFYCMMVVIGLIAFSTTYYQHVSGFATSLGWATVAAGTLVSCVSFGNMALKFIYGVLSDLMGVRNSSIVMFLIAFAGFIMMVLCQHSQAALYVAAVFYGSTMALCAVGAPLLTKGVFGEKDYGAIYGTMSIVTYLVGAVGMSGIGFMYDIYGSYDLAWIVGGIGLAVAMVFMIVCFAKKNTMKWAD